MSKARRPFLLCSLFLAFLSFSFFFSYFRKPLTETIRELAISISNVGTRLLTLFTEEFVLRRFRGMNLSKQSLEVRPNHGVFNSKLLPGDGGFTLEGLLLARHLIH